MTGCIMMVARVQQDATRALPKLALIRARSARTPPEEADLLQGAGRWSRLGKVSKGRGIGAGAIAGSPQSDPAPLPPQTQTHRQRNGCHRFVKMN